MKKWLFATLVCLATVPAGLSAAALKPQADCTCCTCDVNCACDNCECCCCGDDCSCCGAGCCG